jgi:hypothetical protein
VGDLRNRLIGVLTIDDILEATIPQTGVAGAVRPDEEGSAGIEEVEH